MSHRNRIGQITPLHGRSQDFFRGGGTLFQKKFQKILRKFLTIFLRKLLKMHYFSLVFSQFKKAWGNFLRVWTKNAICRKFLRKFSKSFKMFLEKIAKNELF